MAGPTKWKDVYSNDFGGLATTTSWYAELPPVSSYTVDKTGFKRNKTVRCKYPMLALSTSITFDNIDTSTVTRNNKKVVIPTGLQTSEFSLDFLEDASYSVSDYLLFWRQQVVDDNGFYGFERFYRYDIKIKVYERISRTPSNPKIVKTFVIKGAFPVGDLSYAYSRQSEVIQLSQKFGCLGVKSQ